MCQCKTISGTWHQHDRCVSVRPCLGHAIGTNIQCKTMSGTWHQLHG
ncbi:hypothetical protein F383_07243 [Gossypium arboreum]|uniref:Uncharacterized protein n=1 Tax=Gossypium arboreum TaxID=29729 RepID=A0A0B0PLL4_GOSAR|nr:hypothetical protein F383_07243 [Gossypium arboreum]